MQLGQHSWNSLVHFDSALCAQAQIISNSQVKTMNSACRNPAPATFFYSEISLSQADFFAEFGNSANSNGSVQLWQWGAELLCGVLNVSEYKSSHCIWRHKRMRAWSVICSHCVPHVAIMNKIYSCYAFHVNAPIHRTSTTRPIHNDNLTKTMNIIKSVQAASNVEQLAMTGTDKIDGGKAL